MKEGNCCLLMYHLMRNAAIYASIGKVQDSIVCSLQYRVLVLVYIFGICVCKLGAE